MSLTWQAFRDSILDGLLSDAAGAKYTPARMLTYVRWALAEASNHTAKMDSYTWQGDDQTTIFVLPTDMIGTPIKNALVSHITSTKTDYISPYENQPETTWNYSTTNQRLRKVYWAYPSGCITLGFIPSSSEKLLLQYFRIWDVPKGDDDIMTIPQWLEAPVSYFIAAYAMQGDAVNAANIRQWNRKLDSGTPEDNPVRSMSEWYIEQAHRLLNQVGPQDRDTFYRNDPRMPMRV